MTRRPADIALLASYPPPAGGVSNHVLRLLPLLSERGITFTVYNAVSEAERPPTVVSVARRRRTWLLSYILRGREPVIYVFSDRLVVWVAVVWMAQLRRKRVIIRVRNEMLQQWLSSSPWRARLASWALRRTTHVLCVSRALAETVKSMGVEPARILELPGFLPPNHSPGERDGVSPVVWRFMDEHEPVVAANGKIARFAGEDLYGFDQLVELAARLKPRYPRVGVVICFREHDRADDARLDELQERASALGVSDHVLFQVEPGAFVPVIAEADVVVRPTNTDGDANSVREAIYLGTPVVASDAVERPQGSILFRVRDDEDLDAKVSAVLSGQAGADPEATRLMIQTTNDRLSTYLDFLSASITRE